MHTIEPYFNWRDQYIASEDEKSPFHGKDYSEFSFTNKIYNYYIHPQWDEIGSTTLYVKVLYVDYESQSAIIELIGEWNDCIHNDIMFLKRELTDHMANEGIRFFILICDNVLNFHGSDDCYYEEWYEETSDEHGWIAFVNLLPHVQDEMEATGLQYFINFGPQLNDVPWRGKKPQHILLEIERRLNSSTKQLRY